MAYLLHLETATKTCSVALSLNGELRQLKESAEEQFSHGEKLTLFIEEVLILEGINVDELAAISISSGPGSYTGLRIGVSVAKGLCFALQIPLIAVDSLRCIYEMAKKKHTTKTIIPMIDARRMEVFTAIYDMEGTCIKPISATIIDENTYQEFEPFVACGDGAEKLSKSWLGRNLLIDSTCLSSALGQVNLAYQKYLKEAFEDLAYFEPFYLKDFVLNKT